MPPDAPDIAPKTVRGTLDSADHPVADYLYTNKKLLGIINAVRG
jgi:hypothetical protein